MPVSTRNQNAYFNELVVRLADPSHLQVQDTYSFQRNLRNTMDLFKECLSATNLHLPGSTNLFELMYQKANSFKLQLKYKIHLIPDKILLKEFISLMNSVILRVESVLNLQLFDFISTSTSQKVFNYAETKLVPRTKPFIRRSRRNTIPVNYLII